MYLKALEIQGFKSFPQKLRLNFDKPVTGIVGPNGSGKSNISDAIRWVMGEQSSKALRGGKMEDVIFGGTEKRSPMGFSEVSLILDNSGHILDTDSAEVMVTRRYYRSGESEYYINRQSVRLKDVNELFMDTGLGRDGYSIIGQGRIDEILSAKSTDRREIFEEAAGISRFRHRKEESERKLERAEENLLRVNDKISELEYQVEPLRKQAEVAKKYLILRDELRGLEISLWCEGLIKLAAQSEKTASDLKIAKNALSDANRELEALYAAGEEFAEKMRGKDMEAERVREEISACEGRIAELESAKAVICANISGNAENIERLQSDILAQKEQNSGIIQQIDERKKRLAEIEREKAEAKEKLASMTAEAEKLALEASGGETELLELTRLENANLEESAALRARISAVNEQLSELENRKAEILQGAEDAKARLETLSASAKECADSLSEAEEKAQSLRNVIGGYKLRLDSRTKKAEQAKEKKEALSLEISSLRSRRSMLAEMEKEYEGYSRAVKTVMQESERGTLKNIRGPVANLLKTDDEYSVAIETALGAAMQHIIVDTEEDGKAAISLLKRRDAGRATFLPVSSIRGRDLNERGLENENGFVGRAIELVRFDAKYEEIYLSLLGRTVIAEELDSAVKIARKYGNRFRIVTLDGQVINAGGSMTGGSTSKSAGILSRANELKRLSEEEKRLAETLNAAEKAFSDASRERDASEYELNTASEQLRPIEDTVIKLRGDLEHYRLLTDAAESADENAREETRRINEKTDAAKRNIADASEKLEKCLAEAERLRQLVGGKTADTRAISEKRELIMNGISEIHSLEASLEAERASAETSVRELTELSEAVSGGEARIRGTIAEMQAESERLAAEKAQREREISAETANADAKRGQLSKIAEEKLLLEGERSKRDRETQEKNREILDLERENARLEQKAASAEMEEKQLLDKLWDSYELSRTDAMAQRQELESVPEAQKRAGELKREISKLGTPNLGAVEEYERVNTRYTYLTEQRDDIEKAKDELTGLIGEITSEMREIFAREFQEINLSFKNTFTELFGGGKASLELEDPNDILGCGIEIKVQPPGKMLKTITLLSGGEKAFVAIALYFAILKIRPTPFVIMDEIEAALDDANVVRFSEYMRRMTDNTQFLVITHRRRTMEEADVLYGVTMQEKGVSQVLVIDLDEAEKTLAK